MSLDNLTPKMIVNELDKYIVGQASAKKLVAIALRNRIRRMKLSEDIRREVIPKNILMIGPTGVGKTEIARRLAMISDSPFVKVEATKFTEVGYVGKNVESIIRDLVDISIANIKSKMMQEVEGRAIERVEERIAQSILPGKKEQKKQSMSDFMQMFTGQKNEEVQYQNVDYDEIQKRNELIQRIKSNELDDQEIEVEVEEEQVPSIPGLGPDMEDMGLQLGEMFSSFMPKKKKIRKMKVSQAKKVLLPIEEEKLIDKDRMIQQGIEAAQNRGIVFIDEIDKIVSRGSSSGPDVSREGVQRDLLPIVEGTTVSTKHGPVKTDFILFIAAGAFHVSKPSELIPEFQGRFPVRVELQPLTEEDFVRILVEPENALTKQYTSLLWTDDVDIKFEESGIKCLANIAFTLNEKIENIGARRLYTVIEKVLEEVSFLAPSGAAWSVSIDEDYVKNRLDKVVEDKNLREYIL